MTDEKLIEEAAKAMWAANGPEEWERATGAEQAEHLTLASAALAVFEKAHTLSRVGCNICGKSLPDAEPHVCSEPQYEPSDAQVLAAFNAFFDLELDHVSEGTAIRMRAALRAAGAVDG